MTRANAYAESIVDLLAPLGRLAQRPMFGCIALYCEGQVFALLHQDVIYFKVDDQTRPAFEAEGCGPFNYPLKSGGAQIIASYRRAPDRLLDEPDELCAWARAAADAARRVASLPAPVRRHRKRASPSTTALRRRP